MKTVSNASVTINIWGLDIEVTGDVEPYVPAKLTADPDNSSEAEGGVFEIDAVECDGVDLTGVIEAGNLWDDLNEKAYEKWAECKNDGPDCDEI